MPAMRLCLGAPSSVVLGLDCGLLLLSEDKQHVRGPECCCQWYQPGLDMAGTDERKTLIYHCEKNRATLPSSLRWEQCSS